MPTDASQPVSPPAEGHDNQDNPDRPVADDGSRRETEGERLDRNYSELLQELRVSQAGVQILFAFLLTLAFTQRFAETTSVQRGVYVTTLLLAAAASALLIGPVAYHRMVFRRRQKDDLVEAANRMALGGLAALLLAMVGAIMLILDVVLGRTAAVLISSLTAAWFLTLWLVLPLLARLRNGRSSE